MCSLNFINRNSPKDDSAHRQSGPHHSGTQRRPIREDYPSEEEYNAAYSRWRQVRDRNNDAVFGWISIE